MRAANNRQQAPRAPDREAHYQVARAIRLGTLRRPAEFPCTDCGRASEHYDHRDYLRPLDVQPVCRKCNFRRGPAAKHLPPGLIGQDTAGAEQSATGG